MYIFKKNKDLQLFLKKQNAAHRNVGFVPTMGALHEGHLSLLRLCLAQNSLSICSIFVNPTQFDQAEDLEKYPRTTDIDIGLLAKVGCDVLFLPSPEEIYPEGLDTAINIDLNGLDEVMEGQFRTGHFAGVMQVVKRLLDITQANNLYMGQKDYQQFAIIQRMIKALSLRVRLVMGTTIREESGLAKSSRNSRLSEKQKEKAALIYNTLEEIKIKLDVLPIEKIKQLAIKQLSIPAFRLEYFEIVDGETLQTVKNTSDSDTLVACIAVWVGDVRLIDNYILK